MQHLSWKPTDSNSKLTQFVTSPVNLNVENSSIYRDTEINLPIRAGIEVGVASTKAFTSQLIILFMIGVILARRLDKIKEKKYVEMIYQLDNIPKLVKEILEQKNTIKKIAKIIYKKQSFFGNRGVSHQSAAFFENQDYLQKSYFSMSAHDGSQKARFLKIEIRTSHKKSGLFDNS